MIAPPLEISSDQVTPAWAGWEHDKTLIDTYTRRITEHFHEALTKAAAILQSWWSGSLTMTSQGVVNTVEDLIRESLSSVLRNLWQESWYLGSRSAAIAISHEKPDFGSWKPGRVSATEMVANEAGLRHLRDAYGRSVVEGIARTRMDKLSKELRFAMRSSKPDDLIAQLENIIGVSSRAPMIARTEIARAIGAAAMDEYRRAGISQKQWAAESSACPICKENETQGPIAMSADFTGGVPTAPQHPHCMCAVLPGGISVGAVKQRRKVKPPKSTWGGGQGGGARSSPWEEHGYQPDETYKPDQAPAYNPQRPSYNPSENYDPDNLNYSNPSSHFEDQRSGTSAPQNSVGGEPPRVELDDEEDDEDTDAPSKVDVNGQRLRSKRPKSDAASHPFPRRGLPGGTPAGPSHGTQQPEGDNFTLPRRRVETSQPSGNDGNWPPRRGRPPNATGKALTALGNLGRHLQSGRDIASWESADLPQDILNVVKFDLEDGQSLVTAIEDALLRLTRKSDDTEVTHAGLIVRAADTGRILLLQRAVE